MKPHPISQGLLFGSFLYRCDLHSCEGFREFWEKKFGKGLTFVPQFNPLHNYYAKEMGEASLLKRVFFLTAETFPREFLLGVKIESLTWETNWSRADKRMVNADIGFLSLENFLLATTKNFSHRTYLGQNIFADLTYYFHQGKLQTLPWTYPDYVDEEKVNFFTSGRGLLLHKLST